MDKDFLDIFFQTRDHFNTFDLTAKLGGVNNIPTFEQLLESQKIPDGWTRYRDVSQDGQPITFIKRQDVSDTELDHMVFLKVDALVDTGTSFTAYDITCALRTAHPGLNIDRRAVSRIVHQLFKDGEIAGYTRQRSDSIGGQPWEYLPIS